MECLKSKKGVLLEILLIVLPLTVQIYNIVASKLGVHPFAGNLITLVILLMTALFVFLKNIGLLSRIGEYKLSVLATKGKCLKGILLIFVTYWSIISAKRTAFLCVGLVFLFLFLSNMLSITIKSLFRFMGITIVLFGVGYYSYTNYPDFATQADLIIGRFEDPEDNESNRERIDMYQRAYTAFLSSTLLEQLFGHGYKAIERDLYGRPTHNDLLEILYDYGLISLIVYLLFLINLLAHGINMFRANKQNIYLLFTIFNLLLLSMMNCMITNPVFVFVNNFCIGFSLNYFQESKSSSL